MSGLVIRWRKIDLYSGPFWKVTISSKRMSATRMYEESPKMYYDFIKEMRGIGLFGMYRIKPESREWNLFEKDGRICDVIKGVGGVDASGWRLIKVREVTE